MKYILFGAGKKGLEAFKRIGKERVAFFCDNNTEKHGKKIEGIEVLSFEDMLKVYGTGNYCLIVSVANPGFIVGQLEKNNVFDYMLYQDKEARHVIYDNKENDKEKKHNDFLREIVKRSNKEEPIEQIESFKILSQKTINIAKQKNTILNYYTRGDEEEGYRYGNLQTLLRYAGIERKEGSYIPIVSHVNSIPIYSPIFRYKTATVFSGEYYKKLVHERAPWVPIFTVGPYINYAKEIYNPKEFQKNKDEIGTMILAFLPHTLENTSRNFSRNDFLEKVKAKYGRKFDQIWLCVYFADLNDDICEFADKLGIHVVTAGFRFDPHFNDRLKTIIQLADAIVCGDIGGFLTYSISLKKPIARIEITDNTSGLDVQYDNLAEIDVEKTEDYLVFEKKFYTIFNEDLSFTNEQEKWMDPLAGFNLIKDEEYIRKIFEISSTIWEFSEGNYRKYPDAVRKAYYLYNEKDDFERMYMLSQAVGTFID